MQTAAGRKRQTANGVVLVDERRTMKQNRRILVFELLPSTATEFTTGCDVFPFVRDWRKQGFMAAYVCTVIITLNN